jgi:hypothetical protein
VWPGGEGDFPSKPPRLRFQVEEGDEIESFFGQLWSMPRSSTARVCKIHPNLFWIKQDLWESRSFGAEDIFPVSEGDTL